MRNINLTNKFKVVFLATFLLFGGVKLHAKPSLVWEYKGGGYSFAIHPSDSVILLHNADSIKYLNAENGEVIKTFKSPIKILDFQFNQDGNKFAFSYGLGIGGVGFMDYNSSELIKTIDIPKMICYNYVENKNLILVAGDDFIKMIDINTNKTLNEFSIKIDNSNLMTQYISRVYFSKLNNLIAFKLTYSLNDLNNTQIDLVRVIDTLGKTIFEENLSSWTNLAISHDGNMIGYYPKNSPNNIVILDLQNLKVKSEIIADEFPNALYFTYDDKYIVSSHNNGLKIHNLASLKTIVLADAGTYSSIESPKDYLNTIYRNSNGLYFYKISFSPTSINELKKTIIDFNFITNNSTLETKIELAKSSLIQMNLCDINGKIVKILENNFFETGNYANNFSLYGISVGTYIITTTIDGKVQESYKFIKLN